MFQVRDEPGDHHPRERRAGPEGAIGTEAVVDGIAAARWHEPGVLGREIHDGFERRGIVSGVVRVETVARDEMIERRAARAEIVETDLLGRHRGRGKVIRLLLAVGRPRYVEDFQAPGCWWYEGRNAW